MIAFFVLMLGEAFPQGGFDLENTKVDDLSDAQIEQALARARSLGYGENEIYQLAEARGVSSSEITKLRARIDELKKKETEKPNQEPATPEPVPPSTPKKTPKPEMQVYGYDLFRNTTRELSFETTLNIPTPSNYIIGPQDQIVLNIYGAAEKNYQIRVNNRGFLVLPNIGPVFLSGLTVAQSSEKLKQLLGKVFPDLLAAEPSTFFQFSIAEVRTIQVNIIGEVQLPGSYTVNGLSTVFNALYLAGGPTDAGTLREIKVIRRNRLVATLDYYDFLSKGETESNIRLRSDDVIMVGPRLERVAIGGAVKRPGIYELKEGETFADLLFFCGGFNENAYQDKIRVIRNSDREKVISDIYKGQFEIFEIRAGDDFSVETILDRYKNRVNIQGAVFRPGSYALSEGMKVKDLIEKADGLTGDAFYNRAIILRTKSDLSRQTIDVNLRELMNEGLGNVELQREDVLKVLSVFDVANETFVKISGEINKGGTYPFSTDMTVQDLIFMAEGFTEAAEPSTIEIMRLPEEQSDDALAEIRQISLTGDLVAASGEDVTLQPYDHVFVRRNPNYYPERTIELLGEIVYPGAYSLLSRGDRISDLIKRGGGLRSTAYLEGATLTRNTEFFQSEDKIASRKSSLQEVLASLDTNFLNEADDKLIDEIYDELNNKYLFPNVDDVNLATQAKRERLNQLVKSNPFLSGLEIRKRESIAIDLQKILASPGGVEDLILESGDMISVPRELKTIRMRGRVLYPSTIRYEKGKRLRHYIDQTGGFDTRAKRSRTYVVYANGEVSRTKQFLFFRTYPKAAPGCEVIVPVKPLKIPLKPGEIIGLTSGLATLAVLVTQFVQLNQN